MQRIADIAKNFINLLYPLHCAACKKSLDPLDEAGVCEFCLSRIRRNPRPYCKSCGRSVEDAKTICPECRKTKLYFESARSACLYEGVLKELIRLFKYKKKISLAKILSRFMIDFVKEDPFILDGIDIITFVPLGRNRLRERTFNQSKVLALGLSKEFGILLSDTLEKTKSTKPQNELVRDERLINLKNAFKTGDGVKLKGCGILLIDDVMTTGATLNECSRALLDAGARQVKCLTLARGV